MTELELAPEPTAKNTLTHEECLTLQLNNEKIARIQAQIELLKNQLTSSEEALVMVKQQADEFSKGIVSEYALTKDDRVNFNTGVITRAEMQQLS